VSAAAASSSCDSASLREPDTPGLGIDSDPEIVKKYRVS
jgi:L-alanine-DL-glutamate epimerase-like enolase superfamily enzyme